MKRMLSAFLTVILLVGCCAVASATQPEGSGLIGVCMQNMSSSINELQSTALTEMFQPLGYDVQVVSADDSVSMQTQQIQNFILMNAEMIIVLPCEIVTLEDALQEAKDAGIKIVISGGTSAISDSCYDAVSADDEYMIGMYVASITKTWVEKNMDPDGDWDVAFLSSTISSDAKNRCNGEFQIIEPYLKNKDGEYVTLMGEVVDEASRVENPVYCQMIADRVPDINKAMTEMDISGDNRSVVAGVLTNNSKARVIIGYNSLVSTAGSQYIMDTYPEDERAEFAFFSAGVMGDEYEYLIGSVSDEAGTSSVFRGACQFGGGDAAATLANLAYNVMFGEAGVDYGKSNPNSIGLFYPIAAELNGGVPALVYFDTPSYVEAYTYEEILALDGLSTYWDDANGYNPEVQDDGETSEQAGGAIEGGHAYTAMIPGMSGEDLAEIDLMDDGTCRFFLPGHVMLSDAYLGTYTLDGNTVTITALRHEDPASPYTIPGLWDWIDSETGDAVVYISPATSSFALEDDGMLSVVCEYDGAMGVDTLQFDLHADGTCHLSLPGHAMLSDEYDGVYTRDGDTVTITGLRHVDPTSPYAIPGLWSFIDADTGDCVITVDEATGTFAPVA